MLETDALSDSKLLCRLTAIFRFNLIHRYDVASNIVTDNIPNKSTPCRWCWKLIQNQQHRKIMTSFKPAVQLVDSSAWNEKDPSRANSVLNYCFNTVDPSVYVEMTSQWSGQLAPPLQMLASKFLQRRHDMVLLLPTTTAQAMAVKWNIQLKRHGTSYEYVMLLVIYKMKQNAWLCT